MKKSLYLKLSQQEANKKLQSSLYVSYKSIKQRNKLLGWLYFVFTYISFSIVAIVSFIHRLVMLPKDFRFTPHYLRTVIRYENMTLVEANAYLDSQLHEYKNSLSFGNFSPQDRNSIDTTFELLYNEYKLLEPEDTKHTAIISGLSEVKNAIMPISSYTEHKQKKELEEEDREIQLREQQEKRKTSAHNREKGKMLNSFEADLSENQIMVLVEYCNKIPVFDRDIELQEMKDLLLCIHKKPFKLTVNKYLALLFTELAENKLICKNWKSVASNHNCFISSEGKPQTPNDLYMANQTSGLIDSNIYNMITKCIERISDIK